MIKTKPILILFLVVLLTIISITACSKAIENPEGAFTLIEKRSPTTPMIEVHDAKAAEMPKSSAASTAIPTNKPTAGPTATPTVKPAAESTAKPTVKPAAEPTAIPTVKPTAESTATPTVKPATGPTATPIVKPTVKPEPSKDKESFKDKETSKNKKIIAIDAGHQKKGNYDKEPIGPGARTKKAKVSSGTQGRFTKVPEYELTLVIAKKVRDELIDRGYEVVMIREKHEVNISNRERAEIANESDADAFIRIHADGSDNPSVNGTSTLYPSKKNPYVPELYKSSYALSKAIVDSICENTGSKNRGAIARDDMSGINWCTVPVTIIEMGYMTNKTEDKLMQTKAYQKKIVKGICDGIDKYFEEK